MGIFDVYATISHTIHYIKLISTHAFVDAIIFDCIVNELEKILIK